jgi:transposase
MRGRGRFPRSLRKTRTASSGTSGPRAPTSRRQRPACARGFPPARDGGRRASRVEEVPARAREIPDLAARLASDGAELAVMEPTPDYRRTWSYLLEAASLSVQLANSPRARQLAGRLDAQWTARLAGTGLLRPSLVPPPETRALCDLARTRLQLARDRTREWQRLEKPLERALARGLVTGQDEDRLRHPGGHRRRRARPEGPGRLGRRARQGRPQDPRPPPPTPGPRP